LTIPHSRIRRDHLGHEVGERERERRERERKREREIERERGVYLRQS